MWQSTVSPQSTWSAKANGLENWEVKPMPSVTVQGLPKGNFLSVTDDGKVPVDITSVLIKGKHGTTEVPVMVDADGKLVLSAGVTINAEGLVVDLGQIKQGPAGTQPWPVQLSGTLTELFGASLSDRPPASSVSVGATFMVVGTDIVYQSNGTDWVVIS
jgi:hypothetical protein